MNTYWLLIEGRERRRNLASIAGIMGRALPYNLFCHFLRGRWAEKTQVQQASFGLLKKCPKMEH